MSGFATDFMTGELAMLYIGLCYLFCHFRAYSTTKVLLPSYFLNSAIYAYKGYLNSLTTNNNRYVLDAAAWRNQTQSVSAFCGEIT